MLDDLYAFLSPYEADGHEIIIMIDANSPDNDNAVEQFLEKLNLHDLMAAFLPDNPPPTYQRGRNKIDHIWGTAGVLTATTGAGILPFGAGPRSDHPILYADISLADLCDLPSQSLYDPTHPASRNLWSTDIKAAEKYVELVRQGFNMENINTRIAILIHRCDRTGQCTPNDERILNKLDADITKIMLKAEQECKKPRDMHGLHSLPKLVVRLLPPSGTFLTFLMVGLPSPLGHGQMQSFKLKVTLKKPTRRSVQSNKMPKPSVIRFLRLVRNILPRPKT
jgi:hypothetical protein